MSPGFSSKNLRLTPTRLPAHAVLAAAALLAVILLWFAVLRPPSPPRIAIGVLSYGSWGDRGPSLRVRVGITNTGHIALRYNRINFDGNARLRVESPTGWTNRNIGPLAGLPYLSAVLKPGERTEAIILLPAGTLRWQVTYKVRAASFRQRVVASLPPKWFPRLYPLCKRFLSDREGPDREITSAVFECPQHEPVALPDWTPPPFGSDPPWPAPP